MVFFFLHFVLLLNVKRRHLNCFCAHFFIQTFFLYNSSVRLKMIKIDLKLIECSSTTRKIRQMNRIKDVILSSTQGEETIESILGSKVERWHLSETGIWKHRLGQKVQCASQRDSDQSQGVYFQVIVRS